MRGVIIDIGGVLVHDRLLETAGRWAQQLRISPGEMLAAIYGGNENGVLVGRVSEDEWWEIVRNRLAIDTSSLRAELESGQTWNYDLIALLREVKATTRTAILSNAWPSQRSRMTALELTDLVHELLLSCEIGCAKPDVTHSGLRSSAWELLPQKHSSSTTRPVMLRSPRRLASAGRQMHSTPEDTIEAILRFRGPILSACRRGGMWVDRRP
ncbi:MAG: hypothetical protein LC798_22095 [Chloroflexi bacterium]|nr:hypothetical protein [Chloroflexota bacterium]